MRVLSDNKFYCPCCDFECDEEGQLDQHIEMEHYDFFID